MLDRIKELEKENERLKHDLERIKSISSKQSKQKRGFLKFIGHTFAGKRLKQSIYKFLDEYNKQQHVTRNTLSDLLASILYRLTRIGLFTILFAVLPSLLLIQQNFLLKQQNRKIQDQNHLAEASRRSAQMFIMGDVLSDINTELKQQGNARLSPTLAGRVISLSRAMKPYRYFEDGKLRDITTSPERGQLVITLAKSKIQGSYISDAIYQNSDFTYAELSNANLIDAHLQDINLAHADLSNAELQNANLAYSNLSHANLTNVDLTDAQLKLTDFSNANLTKANLRFADIKNVDFTNTTLDNAIVHRADWLEYINTLKLKGAKTLKETYKIDSLVDTSGKKVPTLVRQRSLF